jgi:hypothetical protein
MPSFTDFLVELLEEILLSCSIVDFSLLSRTCKILHVFFSPRIYYTIDWFWDDDQLSPPYHLFLRTLLGNKRLAESDKVLRFCGGGIVRMEEWRDHGCEAPRDCWKTARSIRVDDQRANSAFSTKERSTAVHHIETMAASALLEWTTEFDRGNVDLFGALIVYRTQAVEQPFECRKIAVPLEIEDAKQPSRRKASTTAVYPGSTILVKSPRDSIS